MKKRFPSFLAGAATALALTALATSALAASGQVSFNFAGVALDGEMKITAGSDITAPNGQRVPGSILYTDETGGKTNYLPIRTISELLGVEVGYDSATRTVLLGEQTVPSAAAAAETGTYWHKETDEDGITYASEDTGIDYTGDPGYAPAELPEGWALESVREMTGRSGQEYWNGSGRVSFACSYPNGGGFGWSPGSGELTCTTIRVNGYDAELYAHSSEYGESCLLVWEDLDGILFWITGSDVEPETLAAFASVAAPVAGAAPAYEADWLPSGYSWFETNTSAGTVEDTWTGHGGNITLTYSTSPLLLPEGTGKTVEFGDVTARFWEAEEPHEADEDESETVGGVTVTSTTISGARAADVATLAWTDTETGVNFRLHGTVDQDTLVRIAGSVKEK